MKAVFAVLAALCISAHGLEIPKAVTDKSSTVFAKLVSQAFVHRLQRQMVVGFPSSSKPIAPNAALLPPITDPAWLPTIELPLNFSLVIQESTFINSTGHTSYCEPEVNGMSDLTDEFTLGVIGQISVKWNLQIPSIAIHGPYQLDQTGIGMLFPDPDVVHHITGEGGFNASVKNVFLTLDATASALIGTINLKTLAIDFGYADLTATSENSAVDEDPLDLGAITAFIDSIFKLVWSDANKPMINEAIRCTINHVVGGCTLADLTGGNLECLDISLDPTCFEEPEGGDTAFLLNMDKLTRSSKALGYCDQFTTEPPSTTTTEPTTTTPTTTGPTTTGPTSTGPTSAEPTTPDDGGDDSGSSKLTQNNGVFFVLIAALSLVFSRM